MEWLSVKNNPPEYNPSVGYHDVVMKISSNGLGLMDRIWVGRFRVLEDGNIDWLRYDDISGCYIDMEYIPEKYIVLPE
jgi:hypothetical protein